VQVVTTDNVILLGLIGASEGAFKIVGNAFTEEPYGIGITRGDTQFCEFINGVLAKAAASGAYEQAWASTAGAVEGAQTPDLPPADPCT
jgi:glutamate transport system substrate-binding protein